jgi:hypothetical protein
LFAGLLATTLLGQANAQSLPSEQQLLPGPTRPPVVTTGSMTGCLMRQAWGIQDIDNYTSQIWLDVAGRTERFTFQPNRVELISPSGTPLTTRAQAMNYDMIIRSIEGAGVGRRRITLDFETVSRKVFGVTIEWSAAQCP